MLNLRSLSLSSLFYLITAKAFAECSGDMPCITTGKGLLEGNENAGQAVTTINWGFGAVALGVGVTLGIHAALKFKEQQYGQGLASAAGVVIMIVIFAVVRAKINLA